jgi:hypothetical protein
MRGASRCRGAALRSLLLLIVAAGTLGAPARAAELQCEGGVAVVSAAFRADAALACKGAADAIAFLATLGLEPPVSIPLDIVPRLFDGIRPTAVGIYREAERRVSILSYAEFRKHRTWFDLPIDRTLYRSLVAHEVAHAVAAHNFKTSRPSIQAKEYIAYVAMLSTMAPGAREKVLWRFPGEGFEGEWQMDVAIYLSDPMRFGVRAYRHFLKQRDGREYLNAILYGTILGN